MFQLLEGTVPYSDEDVKNYLRRGWWRGWTLSDYFDRAADVHPAKEGFVDVETRMTYGRARELSQRLALALLDIGVRPLDRVMIQLPNWIEFVYTYFACQRIGAIPVLLIDRYRQYDIGRLAELSGATAWVVPQQYKKTNFSPIIKDVRREYPQIKHVITVRATEAVNGLFRLEELVEKAVATDADIVRLAEYRPDPMQVAHMGPTGGTTGAPKIVPRTHNSLACAVEYCAMSWNQNCEDVNLIAGPVGHDLSFSKGFLGSIFTMGRIVLLDSTDNQAICETIENEKITNIIWVPTLAQRMMQYDRLADYNLSSLEKMHSGGGASHRELIKDVTERLGITYYNGYGGTEGMTCITRAEDDYETVCNTVGRPTCPYDTYTVYDFDGKALGAGEQGELLLKGPGVFSGYFNNPSENKMVFDRSGFFRTGDLARIDTSGYITLTGRTKEMINRGGESISATEIERLISRHPDVAIVAVVPMPDPLLGERACAYIQPKQGATLTFDGVIAFLKQQQASVLELPERIEFVDAMPLTKAQKLDKNVLREDIKTKLRSEAQG